MVKCTLGAGRAGGLSTKAEVTLTSNNRFVTRNTCGQFALVKPNTLLHNNEIHVIRMTITVFSVISELFVSDESKLRLLRHIAIN
jgi:hypothetical protein